MLRTVGTLLVMLYMQNRYTHPSTGQSDHANRSFLRHAIASPRRLRRDILMGLTYNISHWILLEIMLAISSNTVWYFV
jgi:hypothetical protein